MYRSISFIKAENLIEEFGNILSVAKRDNVRDNITGFLVYDSERFFQILEGSRESVSACYAKIGQDVRHGELETLIDEPISQRTFDQWSMGFVNAVNLEEYLTLRRSLHSDTPSSVYDTMARIGILDRMN